MEKGLIGSIPCPTDPGGSKQDQRVLRERFSLVSRHIPPFPAAGTVLCTSAIIDQLGVLSSVHRALERHIAPVCGVCSMAQTVVEWASMTNIALLTLVAVILFMSTGVTGPVSSLYAESLGASYVVIGLLGTVSSLTVILASFIWGRASDRVGQRRVFLVVSLAALSLNYAGLSLARGYGALFVLHIVGAVARAGYGTTSLALMGDLLEQRPDERGRRMGVYRGLASLGFGIMAFLSGRLADRFSLRAPFALAACLAAVACVLALRIRELASPGKGLEVRLSGRLSGLALGGVLAWARGAVAGVWDRALRFVRRPISGGVRGSRSRLESAPDSREGTPRLPLAPLLVSAFLWSLVTGAVYAVWANYMVGDLGYSQAAMSALWSLASTSEFPLMILAGWLSDRIGRLPMLSLGFVAWTIVFVGYVVAPVMPWIVVIQLVRGFAYSAHTATAMTYAAEVRSRQQRGQASGLYSSAGGMGSILGSSMGGTLTQLSGFRTMIATSAALIFAGAAYLGIEAVRWGRNVRARATSVPH
jgi:DHA1 family multidrug resistance protein-like MFS transporter